MHLLLRLRIWYCLFLVTRVLVAEAASSGPADVMGIDWSHASPMSQRYRVTVNGQPVFVGDFWNEHFAQFAFSGRVEVEVTLLDGEINSNEVTVSPLRFNVPWEVDGNRLKFWIEEPRAYVVRLNTPRSGNVALNYLVLLGEDGTKITDAPVGDHVVNVVNAGVDPTGKVDVTNRLRELARDAAPSSVLYFPRGTYAINDWRIERDGLELFLAPGAFLHAQASETSDAAGQGRRWRRQGVAISNAHDVSIRGLGMIEAQGGWTMSVSKSPRFVLDGITIRSDAIGKAGVTPRGNEDGGRGLGVSHSDGFRISNVKVFTAIDQEAGKGKDGLNLGSSSDGLVEHCFTLSGDDSYTIKGRHDSAEWLTVDLGKDTKLDHAVLHWGQSYYPRFALEGSRDGEVWRELVAVENDEAPAPAGQLLVITGQARFVRLQARGKPEHHHRGDLLREFEIYGREDPTVNLARGRPVAVSPFGEAWSEAHTAAHAVDGDPDTSWSQAYFSKRVLFRDNMAILTANPIKIGTGADYAGEDIIWEYHDVVDCGHLADTHHGSGMINFSHYNFDERPDAMAMRRIKVRNARIEETVGLFQVGWYFWRTDEDFVFATDLDVELENVTFDHIYPGYSTFQVIANPETARIRMHFTNLKVAGRWIRSFDDLRAVGVVVDLRGLTDDDETTFAVRP